MDGRLSRGILVRGAIWIALSLPGFANADEVNNEWNSSTRTRSMGNVGIASADDSVTATFFNPAALARLKKASLEVLNLQIDIGGGLFSDSKSLADWTKVGGYSKMMPLLLANPGSPISAGLNVSPMFTAQNLSFGILFDVDGNAYYDKTKNAYYYHSRKLLVPTLGLSAAALGGRFRVGAAVRGVEFNETNIASPASSTSTVTANTNIRNGFGVALDAGALITMPWAGLPTLGFVARNVGGTAFPSEPIVPLGGPAPKRHELLRMTYDGGLSFTPKLGRDQLTWALDYRDALNTTKASMVRHFNTGFEYGMKKFLFFRAGFSQGYWTAGFGITGKTGQLDLGTYGEELEPIAYHGQLDRRYSIRLTRRF